MLCIVWIVPTFKELYIFGIYTTKYLLESGDPDQTAPLGAGSSGYSLFAYIILSYDDAVINGVTSLHKNHMTTYYITHWWE